MNCSSCGAEVPDGLFCTRCGAAEHAGAGRLQHFAAHPGEHVASPNVISTLLPRLHSHHVHLFRWALTGGVALVALLAATGLVVPAIWVAALVVPLLYVSYLRGQETFAREPVTILLSSLVFGAAVGVGLTVAGGAIGRNLSGGAVVALTTCLAVAAVLLTPAGVVLTQRRRYPETTDGLVLGVAAGAGFAIAQTLVNLSGYIGSGTLRVDPSNWVFTLFSAALLIPLLYGSCAGLVSASLWKPRGGHDAALRAAGTPLAVIAAVMFAAGSEVLDDASLSPLFVLLWQAVVVACVLVATRVLLHAAVLDEAVDLGMVAVQCPHCHRHVEAVSFCPHCGVSVAQEVRRGVAAA